MENYIDIKERICANQTEDDWVVLNYDEPVLREFGEKEDLKPGVVFLSLIHILGVKEAVGDYKRKHRNTDQATITEDQVPAHYLSLIHICYR